MNTTGTLAIVWRAAQATMLGLSVLLATSIAVPAPAHAVNDGPLEQPDPKPKPQGPWADIQVKKHGEPKRSTVDSKYVIFTYEAKNIGQTASTNVWGRYECVNYGWDFVTRQITSKGQIGNFSLAVGEAKVKSVLCKDSYNYFDQTFTDEVMIWLDGVPEQPTAKFNNGVIIKRGPA
jgi:hypothetical protein